MLAFTVPMHGDVKWPTNAELTSELLKLWPNLIAYALSFAVIGLMWQNHHALFRTVARVDRKTIFLNLLLLASTAFIPFATATLGAYPATHAATFLYGVVLSMCSSAYNLMLRHLVRSQAFDDSVNSSYIRATVVAYRIGWFRNVCACDRGRPVSSGCQLCGLYRDRTVLRGAARCGYGPEARACRRVSGRAVRLMGHRASGRRRRGVRPRALAWVTRWWRSSWGHMAAIARSAGRQPDPSATRTLRAMELACSSTHGHRRRRLRRP